MSTKVTTFTLKIEPELREQFAHAAKQVHRPAAQLLRDFMRSFVRQQQLKAQSEIIVAAAKQPDTDEYRVMEEINAELKQDWFKDEWK